MHRTIYLSYMWLSILMTTCLAQAASYRVSFEPLSEVTVYQLQISSDPAFKTLLTEQKIRSPDLLAINLPDNAPLYGRIRGARVDGKPTLWYPIKHVKWSSIDLPKQMSLKADEAGKTKLKWPRPKEAPKGNVRYRVRLQRYSDQKILADGLIEGEEYPLPVLPGGNYAFSVEPVGVPTAGTLTREEEGKVFTLIEADAIPYDPHPITAEKRTLLHLTDPFVPGFTVVGHLQLASGSAHSTLSVTPEIRLTGEGGFQFKGTMPFILSDSGTGTGIRGAPRFGGDPFPYFSLGHRIVGKPEKFVALSFTAFLPFDTSLTEDEVNPHQHELYLNLIGRISGGPWIADLSLSAGGSLKGSGLDGVQKTLFKIEPSYQILPRWRAGLEIAGAARKPGLQNIWSGAIAPRAYFQINGFSFASLSPIVSIGQYGDQASFTVLASYLYNL